MGATATPAVRTGRIEPCADQLKEHEPGRFAKWMGTAFSSGNGDHLPPMKVGDGFFLTETQADVMRPELVIEEMDHDDEFWTNASEEGLVRVPKVAEGKQIRLKVRGEAMVTINSDGLIVVDPRGYE